jgi:hypothetical protein
VTQSRTKQTAYAGIVCSVLAVVLVLAAPWHWVDTGEDAAQAGLTLVLSLTVIAIASALMIWTAAWHPQVLLVLAGASTVSCAARLRQRASR